MSATKLDIDDLNPAPYNPRNIDDEAADGLRASVARFGDIGGITYNKRTQRLVCGHQRVKQLRALGAQMVDGALQLASGHRFPVRVVDWTEAEEKAANITANNQHIAGTFNAELDKLLREVQASMAEYEFGDLMLDKLLENLAESADEDDERYTGKVDTPIYEPKGKQPKATELYDATKTEKLLEEIAACKKLPKDVQDFMRCAAMRHTVFDYELIAEFYAHASPDVQRLMEKSALVIIDFDQAVEQGFVTMTNEIAEAYEANRDSN